MEHTFDFLFCVIEALCIVYFFNRTMTKRCFKTKIPAGVIRCGMIFFYIIISFAVNGLPTIAKLISYAAAMIVFCMVCYKENTVVKTGYIAHAYYLVVSSDIIIGEVVAILSRTSVAEYMFSLNLIRFAFALAVKIFNFILINISVVIFKKLNNNQKSHYWYYFNIINICFFLIMYLFISYYPSLSQNLNTSVMSLALSLMFLIISYIVIKMFVSLNIYLERDKLSAITTVKYDLLENQLEAQRSYINEANKARHDLKNIFSTISILLDKGDISELKEYASYLSNSDFLIKNKTFCSNKYIDAVLNLKSRECENKKITLKAEIAPDLQCKLSGADIVLLLSNILDNAMEAVSEMKSENKSVLLKIINHKSNIVIYSSNRFEQSSHSGDFFASRKKNAEHHGFGIQIIKDIVCKEKGDISFDHENGVFEVTIIIPQREL